MKWLERIRNWFRQDAIDEIELLDWVQHNPKIKGCIKVPKYRQTQWGFVVEQPDREDESKTPKN